MARDLCIVLDVTEGYVERAADRILDVLLEDVPGVITLGPRGVGKTTTLMQRAGSIVRLDRAADAAAFRADPDVALQRLVEPILIDEWQLVPDVLGAIKRSIDADPRSGRFLVTGSVRGRLEHDTWPGTGRLVTVPMTTMSEREKAGRLDGESVIDRLVHGDDLVARNAPDLRGYIELALESGFPEACLRTPTRSRPRWLASYVDQMVTRDAELLGERRDPERLSKYLRAYALCSAGAPSDSTIYTAAGVNQRTAAAYESLLERLLIAERVPSWRSNRLRRLMVSPKRYLVDAALLESILGLGTEGFLRDPDLLGRLLDTFVMSQLRTDLQSDARVGQMHHLRTEQGRHEVDLVIERPDGGVVGVEIKATSSPGTDDARHLAWLRDNLGEAFAAGLVLHTGPRTFTLGERIQAAPIAALWG